MKNERGAVKIISVVGIILIVIAVLFGIVAYNRIDRRSGEEQENVNSSKTDLEKEKDTNTIQMGEDDKKNTVVDDKDDFPFKFLKLENKNENMVYSPLSIKYALKMLQEGAKENTYNQIEKVLGNFNLPTYKNIDKKLSLANGIFIRNTYSEYVKENFINTLKNKYNAELKYDEFKNANNVNKWIEEKTFNIIKNMLNDNLVQNPDTKMLLINALAIDMAWEDEFSFEDTTGDIFNLEDGTQITATMLEQETSSEGVSYYLGDDVTALSMDLEEEEDTELEFMAIMPNKNLQEYANKLKIEDIDNITKKLVSASKKENRVKIIIPKFSFDYNLNLKEDLMNMGITDVFDSEKANLSNIADIEKTGKNLYVGEALHKANIDFSEKGVKAAAVTVFAIMDTALVMPSKQNIVKFDKPFLFLIRDKETKEIWFVGTVYKPNLWEDDKDEYTGNN